MKTILNYLLVCSAIFTALVSCTTQSKNEINFAFEQKAIQDVIQAETESYYQQDFEGWQKNFLHSKAFRMYAYWEGWPHEVTYYNGFDTLKIIKAKQFAQNKTIWQGSYEIRKNENFRISRDMAWYTFEQYSFDKTTNAFLGKSLETRILEKINGQWKIAFLGYHYLPKDSSAIRK